jgi:hypothetical protein
MPFDRVRRGRRRTDHELEADAVVTGDGLGTASLLSSTMPRWHRAILGRRPGQPGPTRTVPSAPVSRCQPGVGVVSGCAQATSAYSTAPR